ncbi:MAG: ATP-binding cassette domain-containing protein [Planctomycetes bacterium]|nr:ATP-binding cassette domain-containing protein [Planctomycetota bacterium]
MLSGVQVGALQGVDLTLIGREVTALVGPAESGKSTLLRALLGLERVRGGTLTVAGHRLPRESRRVRAVVGYVGPDPTFYPSQDAASLGRFLGGIHARWAAPVYLSYLEALGIERERRLNELPLAQRMRVSLAAAFAMQPRLVLVDVPDALGDWGRDLLLNGVQQLRRDEAVLIADSRVQGLQDLATRVAVLAQGRVRYTGPVESLLGQLRAYTVADPALALELPAGLTALHRSGRTLYARGAPPDPLPLGLLSARSLDLPEAYLAVVGEVLPGPRARARARSS